MAWFSPASPKPNPQVSGLLPLQDTVLLPKIVLPVVARSAPFGGGGRGGDGND